MPFLRFSHLINSAPWWPITKSAIWPLHMYVRIIPTKFHKCQIIFKTTFCITTRTAHTPYPTLHWKNEGPRFARALKTEFSFEISTHQVLRGQTCSVAAPNNSRGTLCHFLHAVHPLFLELPRIRAANGRLVPRPFTQCTFYGSNNAICDYSCVALHTPFIVVL